MLTATQRLTAYHFISYHLMLIPHIHNKITYAKSPPTLTIEFIFALLFSLIKLMYMALILNEIYPLGFKIKMNMHTYKRACVFVCIGKRQSDVGTGVLYRSQNGYYELVGVLGDKQSCQSSIASRETNNNNSNNSNYDYYLPMFTRINSYINWILENTRDGCYCNKP